MRSQGVFKAVEPGRVTWSDTGEPQSPAYHDCYFSSDNGLEESRHVFIDGNSLPERFPGLGNALFSIGELGFGTGLNFLLTVREFLATAPPTARLYFWSVDRHPLTGADLRRALALWPALAEESRELLGAYPPLSPGIHRRHLFDQRVMLDLVWADGEEALEELAEGPSPFFDAWYLDGFAPSRNPNLWSPAIFTAMARCSRPNATLSTYSAAGIVRRGLSGAGFTVNKRPGYGSKRESVQGTLRNRPAAQYRDTPWHVHYASTPSSDRVMVLGGGLAGAQVAAALARRGRTVAVFEAASVAAKASGNRQGLLFTRLSAKRSPLADFSLAASLYGAAHYRELFRSGVLTEEHGALNGCIQLGEQAFRVPPQQLEHLEDLARALPQEATEKYLGTSTQGAGLWFGQSGWLAPAALCRTLLAGDGITLRDNCGPLTPRYCQERALWQLLDRAENVIDEAATLVLAAGLACRELAPTADLPLAAVRGQTTHIPASAQHPLSMSCAHAGYIAPAQGGLHCIGATFKPKDEGIDLRPEEHRENLAALAEALPDWSGYLQTLDPDTLEGRAELRCVTRDYLPLVGPVADLAGFRDRYGALAQDARQHIEKTGAYLPGLYLSVGHGSRGLAYAALAGELIASQLCGEAPPVSRDVLRALSPARFAIRAIIRGEPHS